MISISTVVITGAGYCIAIAGEMYDVLLLSDGSPHGKYQLDVQQNSWLTAQKQQAITVIMILQGLGVTMEEIFGLSKILDLGRTTNLSGDII